MKKQKICTNCYEDQKTNSKPTIKEILSEIEWPLIFITVVILSLFAGAAYETYFAEEKNIGRTWYAYSFDMEGAIGERHMLEREVREIQGSEAQERVENGTATEHDREIAADHTIEHLS